MRSKIPGDEKTMEKIRIGDNVRYLGYTKEQVNWGNNDTPYMLIVDRTYEVINVIRRSQHTKGTT